MNRNVETKSIVTFIVFGLLPLFLQAQVSDTFGVSDLSTVVDDTFSTVLPRSWSGGGINNVAPTGVSILMAVTKSGEIITTGGGITTNRNQNEVILLNSKGQTIEELPRQLPNGYDTSGILTYQKDHKSIEFIYNRAAHGDFAIARFLLDGTLDTTFLLAKGFNNQTRIRHGTVDNIGNILIYGEFGFFDNVPKNRILRLKSNGVLDVTFDVGLGPSSRPYGIASQPNGSLLVWGGFESFNNGNHPYLVRLHDDGTIDEDLDQKHFANNIPSAFLHAVPLNDSKILIGGFQSRNVNDPHIVRLNQEGTIDQTFNGRFDIGPGFIKGIRELENGQFLIWGTFRKGIILLNQDGSVDESFDAGLGPGGAKPSIQGVYTVEQYNETSLLAGGYFMSFDGHASQALVRIHFDWSKFDRNLDNTGGQGTPKQKPDLIVSSIATDVESTLAGDRLTVNVTVKNIGTVLAEETTTRIRLSDDSRLNKEDVLPINADITTPPIGVGDSVDLTHEITIPDITPSGRYYLGAFVDVGFVLSQVTEGNDAGLSDRKLTINRHGDRPVIEQPTLQEGLAGPSFITIPVFGGQYSIYNIKLVDVFSKLWTVINSFTGNGTIERYYLPVTNGVGTSFYTVERVDLKLPLPGDENWLLTTEIGCRDCESINILESHIGVNYHSLDFDNLNTRVGQVDYVPILAAASGVVFTTSFESPIEGNGNYVVIDHDYPYDGNGLTTRYLHLKEPPIVVGNHPISQGDPIGIMGNTDVDLSDTDGDGIHLHFGVRYNKKGFADIPELQTITLEGMRLEKFRVSDGSAGSGYYLSSNRVLSDTNSEVNTPE